MRSRPFGSLQQGAGPEVPEIGIGTWNMERDDRASAIAAIRRALELGMTHVDTAEMYGRGEVERVVGEAIAGQRDRVFLVSKVLPNHARHDAVIEACEASLRRLGTDHLDVYLLHWRDRTPLEETFTAFERLIEDGKIRAWGVSNFDVDDLDEALAIVGPDRIACNQVLYHLNERAIERRVLPWCREHGVTVVGYSPFGSRGGFPASRVLAELARRLDATPRQLALAFLKRAAFAIPKTSNAVHVEELAGADRIVLDDAALAAIEAAFPVRDSNGLPML